MPMPLPLAPPACVSRMDASRSLRLATSCKERKRAHTGRAISVAVGFAACGARVQPPCPALAYAGAWAGRLDCTRAGWVAGACLPAACRWPLCTAASHPAATSVPHRPPDPPPRPATRPDRAGRLQGMEGAATLPRDHAVALWLGSVPGEEEAGRARLKRALGKRADGRAGQMAGHRAGLASGLRGQRAFQLVQLALQLAGQRGGCRAAVAHRKRKPPLQGIHLRPGEGEEKGWWTGSRWEGAPPGHPPAPGRGRRKGLVDRQLVGGRLWASAGRLDGTAAMHGSHPQKRYPPPPNSQPARAPFAGAGSKADGAAAGCTHVAHDAQQALSQRHVAPPQRLDRLAQHRLLTSGKSGGQANQSLQPGRVLAQGLLLGGAPALVVKGRRKTDGQRATSRAGGRSGGGDGGSEGHASCPERKERALP